MLDVMVRHAEAHHHVVTIAAEWDKEDRSYHIEAWVEAEVVPPVEPNVLPVSVEDRSLFFYSWDGNKHTRLPVEWTPDWEGKEENG